MIWTHTDNKKVRLACEYFSNLIIFNKKCILSYAFMFIWRCDSTLAKEA